MTDQAIANNQNNLNEVLVSPSLSTTDLELTEPLKLGIMASGSGTNFEAIVRAIDKGKLKAEIKVLIYNNREAKVRSRAEKWQIPAVLLDHREYKQREALDRAIVATLKEYGVEWVVMAGWMRVVTGVLLDAFPNRVINIHPSLLPSFRGIRAVEQALRAKVKIAGCTVHLVTSEVDSGPILIQAAVPILPDDTAETLHARIQVQEHKILPQAIAIAAKQYYA
ncbi:phosphoribosylglycinamide formyltransferase [Pleurocapsales cyanobacterium LEGE 06147]|nr:phosphoribosylglycinamide formyltransferase [Pleurocapsales cyanobacterium LEGE 06147]